VAAPVVWEDEDSVADGVSDDCDVSCAGGGEDGFAGASAVWVGFVASAVGAEGAMLSDEELLEPPPPELDEELDDELLEDEAGIVTWKKVALRLFEVSLIEMLRM